MHYPVNVPLPFTELGQLSCSSFAIHTCLLDTEKENDTWVVAWATK